MELLYSTACQEGVGGPGKVENLCVVGEPRPRCKWTTNTFAYLRNLNNVDCALLDGA